MAEYLKKGVGKALVYMCVMISPMTYSFAQRQVPDSLRLKDSAMNYLFQRVDRSPVNYTETRSFVSRSYLSAGIGMNGIWGMRDEMGGSSRGTYGQIAFGNWLTPVHGAELSVNLGFLPYAEWRSSRDGVPYKVPGLGMNGGVDLNYLLNLTNFALRTEDLLRWQLVWSAGLGLKFQERTSVGVNTAFRFQYNLTPLTGLFVAPGISVFTNNREGPGEKVYKFHALPSISAGIQLRFNGTKRNEIHRFHKSPGKEDGSSSYNPALVLKTNMLYWLLAAPNISVELPIKDHFSIAGEYIFPWFKNRDAGFCYQLLTGSVEGRYWFDGATRLQGHFAGLYYGIGKYDFQYKEHGYQGRFHLSTGLVYGYSKPISKNCALEFSIGLGALKTTYEEYYPDQGCLVYKQTKSSSYFGITKAQVSLVWNIWKGGKLK